MAETADRPFDEEDLRSAYKRYDHCVDIVSAVEVWFTKAGGIRETVAHFERFPTIDHEDGEPATPDFTVLFQDRTAYVGELSNLSLHQGSLDSLARQLTRYDQVRALPDSSGVLVPVTAVDVLLFVPHAEANAAVGRLSQALEDADHDYHPGRFPSVFAWSFDAANERYVFTLASGERNERPRGHDRAHSLERWMESDLNPDTLAGLARHFTPIKVARRFVNDQPPVLYLAVLLWSAVFPTLSGGAGDIRITASQLAERLRDQTGRGYTAEVKHALAFLAAAGLARRHGDHWVIGHRPIARHEDDLADTLLQRYSSKPSGPVTVAGGQKAAEDRRERQANRRQQIPLGDPPS